MARSQGMVLDFIAVLRRLRRRQARPHPGHLPQAYHYPQVRNAVRANPKGIVASSPGLRACELPWEIVQNASQHQRGCGPTLHPRTQPRWGWLVLTRWTQGSSFLATLGFVAESLRDSCNFPPKMCVMISPQERENHSPVAWRIEGL